MEVLVLNGWAASPHAWELCSFARGARLFSYVEQLDGVAAKAFAVATEPVSLVGWSMGGSTALALAASAPEKVAALVLVAATPRMMEDRESGWKGMSPRRLDALRRGLELTHGEGFFGLPEGRPNPYMMDEPENLERGLAYLRETDLRARLIAKFGASSAVRFPVFVFQSEHDGIVRATNAAFLKEVFPWASVEIVPGNEHALPVTIPDRIDAALSRQL